MIFSIKPHRITPQWPKADTSKAIHWKVTTILSLPKVLTNFGRYFRYAENRRLEHRRKSIVSFDSDIFSFNFHFQLFTAALMIYSTFAAIYYSKVNPVVGDYDYTSYLGGARSMADDPEPTTAGSSPLSELANSYLFQTASHGFQFVLDAIEKNHHT